jgi:hypothetical protein
VKGIFIGTVIIFTFLNSTAQSKDEIAIRRVLTIQVNAWNNGDIDSFMQGYWQNDSLMFIGKSGTTYGWKHTHDNYKIRYPDTASMGKLNFILLEFKSLSPLYYFAVGNGICREVSEILRDISLYYSKKLMESGLSLQIIVVKIFFQNPGLLNKKIFKVCTVT